MKSSDAWRQNSAQTGGPAQPRVYTHVKFHFLTLYLLHFPTLYPLSNVSLAEGRVGIIWVSSEPQNFLFFPQSQGNLISHVPLPRVVSGVLGVCSQVMSTRVGGGVEVHIELYSVMGRECHRNVGVRNTK
jgi:hypothetical protein